MLINIYQTFWIINKIGISGGIPEYLTKIDPSKTVEAKSDALPFFTGQIGRW